MVGLQGSVRVAVVTAADDEQDDQADGAAPDATDAAQDILEAAAAVIARDGVDGLSMRSIAREADVSLGLLSYHFDDKSAMVTAAFQRATDVLLERALGIIDDDVELGSTAADQSDDPVERLRVFLRGAFSPEFLATDYLTLRITLWAFARTDPDIAEVERSLYLRYADHLQQRIAEAFPELNDAASRRRATDVIVVQNGLWLNWARYQDNDDLARGVLLCERIALASTGDDARR